MPRRDLNKNVFEMAVERMQVLTDDGHRLVVSFSAGKDSGVSVEVCLLAMKASGRLIGYGGTEKLSVVMRDEEIMYPGTFEYAERMAARPEIDFHWLIANQPIVNVFDRANPYFWVFDPMLEPEQWVRQPPAIAKRIDGKHIGAINGLSRFPPPAPDKKVYSVLGLRTSESARRMMGLHSSGGYICLPGKGDNGMWGATPLYDWQDEDIWLAIKKFKWDYNSAYDTMNLMGVPKNHLRIAPPTLNAASVSHLGVAARAWPNWFDKVCKRLKGVRTAAQFGSRAVEPFRRVGETWEDCFKRECIHEAPAEWIAERAMKIMEIKLAAHSRHATTPFPETTRCKECTENGSWQMLARNFYNGDPFSLKTSELPYVEPEFFRPGAGTWAGGSPTWGA